MLEKIKRIRDYGNYLFQKRLPLLSYWQEVAENFNPMMADFTREMYFSERFGDNLVTSAPLIICRELTEQISAMLRPKEQSWFKMDTEGLELEAKRYLEWMTTIQRNAMYDPRANMSGAAKQCDGDYVMLGNAVLSAQVDLYSNSLVYQRIHLRNAVWCDDHFGRPIEFHIKWKTEAANLERQFSGNISNKVKETINKGGKFDKITARHTVMKASEYEGSDKVKNKWASIWYEEETGHILEEKFVKRCQYIAPRWKRTSIGQYGYSPAAITALPDARLLQSMTLSLLEAGEKAVNPPLVGKESIIRSDVQMLAGGITWATADYDERMGRALQPLFPDSRGMPYGFEFQQDLRQQLASAFYLNKLTLPQTANMTAFEVAQRVQEYVRSNMPLFEPIEEEYSNPLCELTHSLLLDAGAFGSWDEVPQEIRGRDVPFRFKSPLQDLLEKQKGEIFMQSKGLTAQALEVDPAAAQMIDMREALRDTLDGIGAPAKWMRSDKEMQAIQQQQQQQQEAQQMLQTMQQSGQAAESLGRGAEALGFTNA